MEDYKYLGVNIDNGLNWKTNRLAVYKKGMSRLYSLRKLRSFNVCSRKLEMFYQSVVASVLFFTEVCWGSRGHKQIEQTDQESCLRNRLQDGRV